jgi:phosphatase NudJ
MSLYIGVGLVLVQGDRYILVQEVRNEKKNLYNLPAGTLDSDEDLMTCVIRETSEETGVSIALKYFVGIYQTVLANGNNIIFSVFAASIAQDVTFHSEEHTVVKALAYDEIVALDAAGKLRAPTVLKAITDYRNGQRLHLSAVQSWHLENLSAITVDKDH